MSDEDSVLRAYYEAGAPEFDEAYAASPFALRVEWMVADLRAAVRGRRTLEIACGTGFWTALAAEAAAEIVACDTSPAMLALARERLAEVGNVSLVSTDAYRLDAVEGSFEAAFALQWLSHVPKRRLHAFLENLHSRLRPGAVVFLADNSRPWDRRKGGPARATRSSSAPFATGGASRSSRTIRRAPSSRRGSLPSPTT